MPSKSNIRWSFYKYLQGFLKISIFIIIGFASSSEAASDVEIQLYISQELNNIPNYCQIRLAEVYFEKEYSNRKNIPWPPYFQKSLNKWENAIGKKNWGYFHHYCFGVIDIQNYMAMDSDQKLRYKHQQMKRALGQFEFMRNANTVNFPLWYQLYIYEFYIYSELGDIGNAQRALKESLKYRSKK